MEDLVTHAGGCHCGAVTFEVDASAAIDALECNCSLCLMLGFQHLIVPAKQFRLLTGQDDLSTYTFNTGVAQHHFCKICGVKSFYVPRSNPDGFSINVRCMDTSTVESITLEPFDGVHWEDNAEELRRLTE